MRTEKKDLPDVYLSLGANVGDPVGQLRRARSELGRRGLLLEPIEPSSLYRTPPWGDIQEQPWFVNAVVVGATRLPPHDLLAGVQKIEADFGRQRTAVRWGPREIDLDILLYGRVIVATADLVIPHPAMTRRAFVLVPLLEIAPDLTDPVTGERYARRLEALADDVRGIEKLPDTL